MRSTTGQAYIGISKAFNTATGGSNYEQGVISPTPERVRYLAQVMGGGLLREIEKTINVSTSDDKAKKSQIPVLGRFAGEVDDDQVQMRRYYDSIKKLKTLESSFKIMGGDGKAMEKFMEKNPEIAYRYAANATQQSIAVMNKMAVQTIGDPAKIKEIDKARIEHMRSLNMNLKMLEQSSGKVTPGEEFRKATRERFLGRKEVEEAVQ